jgi:hypothetical protein
MPNNPLTQQELYEYGILRTLTPSLEVVGRVSPYFPAGYFLIPPHDEAGEVLWRKFHAGYISEGIIDPNRLGTGSTGAGNLYLADDGTWKTVSAGIDKVFIIDYDYNIIGARDGINTNYSTSSNFVTGTTRVYLNGVRLTRGVGYDYVEVSNNQITLDYSPVPSDRLIIEYEQL